MSGIEQRARDLISQLRMFQDAYARQDVIQQVAAGYVLSSLFGEAADMIAALASQAQVLVSDGWTISREGEDVRLTADGVASFLVKRSMFRGSLEEFVWLFLNDMAAAPAPELSND